MSLVFEINNFICYELDSYPLQFPFLFDFCTSLTTKHIFLTLD